MGCAFIAQIKENKKRRQKKPGRRMDVSSLFRDSSEEKKHVGSRENPPVVIAL